MELIVYNTKQSTPKNKPFVSLGRKGLILLSKSAEQLLELNVGDYIEFAQDKQSPGDWFIRKCKKSNYLLKHNTDKSLICYGQEICKKVKSDVFITHNKTVQFILSESKENGWTPIITSKYKIV